MKFESGINVYFSADIANLFPIVVIYDAALAQGCTICYPGRERLIEVRKQNNGTTK